jgi:hypothetical protein
MKEIKINFEGFSVNFDYKLFLPYKILLKHFDVKIIDNPDYLFCSGYKGFHYCKFSGIRIFFMGELFFPDYNLVDYAFSPMNIQYDDRLLFIPFFMYTNGIESLVRRKSFIYEDIHSKNKFCNFIYSREGIPMRTELFNKVSSYKHVDSAGKYLNNMNGFPAGDRSNARAGFSNKPKWDFQKDYKFSIVCENAVFSDYITEKIIDAYMAATIPIYYGDKSVVKYFNPKSFVNYSDYSSDKEFIERIKEIDNNNELFLDMLNQNIFNDSEFINHTLINMENFLLNIFNQSYESAFRRPRILFPLFHQRKMLLLDKLLQIKYSFNNIFRR